MYVALSGLAAAPAIISLYYPLQRADVVIVSPIASISPLVTLLLAHVFLSRLERVTQRVIVGTVLAGIGVILVIFGSTL